MRILDYATERLERAALRFEYAAYAMVERQSAEVRTPRNAHTLEAAL